MPEIPKKTIRWSIIPRVPHGDGHAAERKVYPFKYPKDTVTPIGKVTKCQSHNPSTGKKQSSYRIQSPTGIIFWINEKELDEHCNAENQLHSESQC